MAAAVNSSSSSFGFGVSRAIAEDMFWLRELGTLLRMGRVVYLSLSAKIVSIQQSQILFT
jgi:hypothetical protein